MSYTYDECLQNQFDVVMQYTHNYFRLFSTIIGVSQLSLKALWSGAHFYQLDNHVFIIMNIYLRLSGDMSSDSITRKLCYRKDDRAMHPTYGCPENFWVSLTTSTATIPNIFMGFFSGRPYECSYKI